MAWTCSATTNDALVDNLVQAKLVNNEKAIQAMRSVNRGNFVPSEYQEVAYEDRPLPIGYNVTISAPHMHAMMLDLMAPHLGPGTTALDIGSGSGYITACMSYLCDTAYGIEHISPLVSRSISCINRPNVEIFEGDGRMGDPEHCPFDVIHVGAAADPEVVPVLLKQLKSSGCLIIPVQERVDQVLYKFVVDKNGKVEKNEVCGVRFVPLNGKPQRQE